MASKASASRYENHKGADRVKLYMKADSAGQLKAALGRVKGRKSKAVLDTIAALEAAGV